MATNFGTKLNEFWDKNDYNSAPVKDNCALFAPTPISGPGLSDGVI